MATPRARGANHRQAQLLCADARSASRQSQPTRTRASFSCADDGSVARRWDGESGGGLRRRQNRHLLLLLLFSLRSCCRLFDEDEDEENEEDDDFCARSNDADASSSSSSSSASEVEVDDDIDRSFLCVSTSTNPLCVSHAELDVFRPSPSSHVVVVMVVYRVSSTSIVCTNRWMDNQINQSTDDVSSAVCVYTFTKTTTSTSIVLFTYTRCSSSCTRLDCVATCRRRRRRRRRHACIHASSSSIINTRSHKKSPTVQLPKQTKEKKG